MHAPRQAAVEAGLIRQFGGSVGIAKQPPSIPPEYVAVFGM